MPNQSFVYNMLHDDALGVERLLADRKSVV